MLVLMPDICETVRVCAMVNLKDKFLFLNPILQVKENEGNNSLNMGHENVQVYCFSWLGDLGYCYLM